MTRYVLWLNTSGDDWESVGDPTTDVAALYYAGRMAIGRGEAVACVPVEEGYEPYPVRAERGDYGAAFQGWKVEK